MGFVSFLGRMAGKLFGKRPMIHYWLAHGAIRTFVLHQPISSLSIFSGENGPELLQELYDQVCAEFPEEKPTFKASEVKLHPIIINNFPAIIFEFPEPKKVTQVFFTALVVLADPKKMASEQTSNPLAKYFTLELT